VNCAALPGHLLEEELFGCERERAIGVARTRAGKLELCDKGTLFLEEITEMPADLQHTLLNVLQSKQLVRVGGDKPVPVDVRILAATSANIDHAVSSKKLREDLYYRLSAFTMHLPPLRQRKEEIPLLLHHFMQQLSRHYSLPAREFSQAALEASQRYGWPGNLSELESFVKRYLVMPDHEFALADDPILGETADTGYSFSRLAPVISVTSDSLEQTPARDSLKSLVQSVKLEAEKNAISAALQRTGWNRKAAARMLKVSYRALLYKIDQYHLRPSGAPQFPGENDGSGNGNGNRFKGNGTAG